MKKTLTTLFLIGMALGLKAQDTIRVGHKFKMFKHLEMGIKTDLIHHERNGVIMGSVKTRTTELVTLEGQELLKITHAWKYANNKNEGKFVFYCSPETLEPIAHFRTTANKGLETFSFSESQITAIDTVKAGVNSDFNIALEEPSYNWEIDLETYSLIPMKKGKKVVMNFYHPGGNTNPGFYTMEIIGSEKLPLADGSEMDCWILFTDYNGTQKTKFWYTKKHQNFVKMEGEVKGMKLRKTRLYL